MSFLQQTLPWVSFFHEGLTQQLTLYYTSEDGKRTYFRTSDLSQYKNKVHYRRDVCLHLPLLLTPLVWERYGYSIVDIKSTLVLISTDQLYQLGLLLGISPSNSAVRIAFSSQTSIVFSSKANISRKIIEQLQKMKRAHPRKSCLDTLRQDHVPALPLVPVHPKVYAHWCSQIPKCAFTEMEGNHWDEAWQFKDIQMVPFWIEKDALLMTRIIAEDVFKKSGRIANSLATKPMKITLGKHKKVFCGVGEACFMVPKRASEKELSSVLSTNTSNKK